MAMDIEARRLLWRQLEEHRRAQEEEEWEERREQDAHDPQQMHPEMVPLVDALNRLPGITTHASCTGKDGRGMWVTFCVERMVDLVPLAHCLGDLWTVTLEPADEDPPYFCLEGPAGAYRQTIAQMADRISEWAEETT